MRRLSLLAFFVTMPSFAAAPPRPHVDQAGDPLPPGAVARLGSARLRPGGPILALAVSHDGKSIATGGPNGVRLWDVATGRTLVPLTTSEKMSAFGCVRFSADDKRLLAGSADGHVCAWDVRTGKALFAFRVLGGECKTASYDWSADGRRVAALLPGHCAEVWDIDRERRLLKVGELPPPPAIDRPLATLSVASPPRLPVAPIVMSPPEKPVALVAPPVREPALFAVALSPDGERLACVRSVPSKAHELQFLDVATGKACGWREQAVGMDIQYVRYSRDGRRVFVGSRGRAEAFHSVSVYDAATGKQLSRVTLPDVQYLALAAASVEVSPDGGRAVVIPKVPAHLNCYCWELKSVAATGFSQADPERVAAAAFSPDGKTLYTGGSRGLVRAWDAATGKEKPTAAGLTAEVVAVCWTPDGKGVITAASDDIVRHYDALSGKLLHHAGPFGKVRSLQMAGGRLLVGLVGEGKTRGLLLHWPSGKGATLPDGLLDEGAAWLSPDGRRLARWRGEELAVFDAETGERRDRLAVTARIRDGQFSPDGRYFLFVGDDIQEAGLWDLERPGGAVARLPGDWEAGSFSPDARSVLLQRKGGRSFLFEIATTEQRATRTVLDNPAIVSRRSFAGWRVMEYLYHTGNGRLALREGDGEFVELPCHGKRLGPAPSPDGRLLATACADGVLVWDLGRLLSRDASGDPPAWARRRTDYPELPQAHTSAFLAYSDTRTKPRRWLPSDPIEEAARTAAAPSSCAEAAFAAIEKLAANPERAVQAIRRLLVPPKHVDDRHLQKLVASLDAEDYDDRRRAEAELRRLGPAADEALRHALDGAPSPQVRRTAAKLRESSRADAVAIGRLFESLERCGTAEARALVKEYTQAKAAAWFRREALAALGRDVAVPVVAPVDKAPALVAGDWQELLGESAVNAAEFHFRHGLRLPAQAALLGLVGVQEVVRRPQRNSLPPLPRPVPRNDFLPIPPPP